MKKHLQKIDTKNSLGFSLPEILVSIAIMAFIATTVIYNQGDFNDRIALGGSASDVELQIREAQVYGISVREFQPGTSEFDSSYGIHFNLSGSGSNNSFLFFADRGTKNKIYDGTIACLTGGANECIRRFTLSRNNIISDICVILSTGVNQCYSGGFISRFDAVFIRPSPSANIAFFNTSGTQIFFPNHQGAKIVIRSPKGSTKEVILYASGQISIQ